MRLIYTDMGQDLTAILAREAVSLAASGRRVFYIAPNSLSFEKERQVLELLPQQASFTIIVTRFAQMARYLTLNTVDDAEAIDDTGLSMLFYRVLSQLEEEDLRVYGRLRNSTDFVRQLVELYKDLQAAGLTAEDLTGLDSAEKQADLEQIFTAFYALLRQENYQSQTKIGRLTQQITTDPVTAELDGLALVIDGFTRFSAEEADLVAALEAQGVPIVIGTYANPWAYQSAYITGSLYQASVDFLRELAARYQTKPEYLTLEPARPDALSRISEQWAARYDFTAAAAPAQALEEADQAAITIWEAVSQKEEVTHVAKQIRRHLAEGYRYKDILVLLGDTDSYRLQIGKIFDRYDIPYYFAKAESMAQHPLVALIDALVRLKRYRFRTEDVLNLLKTGLYGSLSPEETDKFDQYVTFAQIRGAAAFGRPFSLNLGEKFDLEVLNRLRQETLQPLFDLLQVRKQTGSSLVKKLTAFLEAGQVTANLASLAAQGSEQDQEQAEQVWQLFGSILQQFNRIFGQEKLGIEDCLSLIRAGMMGAGFRTVPPTLDVVTVKSYDLITPRAKPLVFAIGLTQGNFPKAAQNTSLLSDEERLAINEAAGERRLDVASREQSKRSHFTALSLINAASDHLVLSAPQLFKEAEEPMSPYLLSLLDLGLPKLTKGPASFEPSPADIGNYKGLLAAVVELNRQTIEEEMDSQQQTFWSAAVRSLRKKLAAEGLTIPQISPDLHSQPLAPDTLAALYPPQEPLRLSASSLRDFYDSEYSYFLRHVLRLQEVPSALPDARINGSFLHQVFEQVLQDQSPAAFDQKVALALQTVSQTEPYRFAYSDSSQTQFTHAALAAIAQSTATVLRDDRLVRTEAEEQIFRQTLDLPDGRTFQISGIIDRIDRLKADRTLGVIDYKSSSQSFQIDRFYNGLSPQLLTYLMALRTLYGEEEKTFGAAYLHMTEPLVQLGKLSSLDEAPQESLAGLKLKGLFVQNDEQDLPAAYAKTAATSFTPEELEILLTYTAALYQRAGQKILQGRFAINPYSEDGRSVAGSTYSSITHFEADQHLGQARRLVRLGRRKQDWLDHMQKERETRDDI